MAQAAGRKHRPARNPTPNRCCWQREQHEAERDMRVVRVSDAKPPIFALEIARQRDADHDRGWWQRLHPPITHCPWCGRVLIAL